MVILGFASIITACEKDETTTLSVPTCISEKIQELKDETIRNPPAQIWQWEVDGGTYFYISSDCCDQFNYLYNEACDIVCSPDGGFSGAGDGSCPEFTGEIKKTLIWKDSRG